MLSYVCMCVCDCDESSEPKLMFEVQQKKLQRVPTIKQLATVSVMGRQLWWYIEMLVFW